MIRLSNETAITENDVKYKPITAKINYTKTKVSFRY